MWTFWPPAVTMLDCSVIQLVSFRMLLTQLPPACNIPLSLLQSLVFCCYLCYNCCCREFQLEIFIYTRLRLLPHPSRTSLNRLFELTNTCKSKHERIDAHECACAVYETSTSVHTKCSWTRQADQPDTGHWLTIHKHTRYSSIGNLAFKFILLYNQHFPTANPNPAEERFSAKVFHLHCTYLPLC